MRARLGLLVLPVLLVAFLGMTTPAFAAHGTSGTATASATGLQRSSTNTDDGTSWATSVPSFQQPTNHTNNEPVLIIGVAVLAVLVIGGLAALVRLRARGDNDDL